MHVTKKMLFSVALAAIFFLTGCWSADAVPDSATTAVVTYDAQVAHKIVETNHENVTLSDMVYERPDIDAMRTAIEDLQDGITRGENAEDLIIAYQILQRQYDHADSMLSLIYLLYALDVTNTANRDEYAYLQSALSELDANMQAVSETLFESSDEAEGLAKSALGEGYVDAIIQDERFADATIQDLQDQDEELTLEYDNLAATFTLLDNGMRWTYDDIQNDMSLSNDEYYRLYDAYNSALNKQVGEIFLQQVEIRTEIASRLGYTDYATYCYEGFGRDYSPQDARTLHAAVKRFIAPLFVSANRKSDTSDLDAAYFEEDAFFNALSISAAAFSPQLNEAVSYMLRNRLYDVTYNDVKMDSGFTTYISDYRAPFIFSTWTGSSDDIASILHELGHFTNYYFNAEVGNSAGESLDLAEVDSQALVLLLFDQYENFYGKYADEARIATLIDAMYSLLSGCMEDEFQQDVYENPDMTLEELNALYKNLAVEYKLDEVYGFQGTEWVLISHTFQMPMYYISYAVSMVPALELFELSQSDDQAAKTVYNNIVMREQYSKLSEVLSQNGLGDVFSARTIADIADHLRSYLS